MTQKLKKSLRGLNKDKQDRPVLYSGELGVPLNGTKTVEVPNRKGFVFVRLKGNTSELIQAHNAVVSPVYGLPVLVGRQGNIYQVVGHNIDTYQGQANTPYLPKHGPQHSFNHNLGIGGDIVWVYSQQFMPLLSYPSGTNGSMSLVLEPSFYEWNGSWRYAQNTGTPSYTPYLPTITGSARMVLSYIDPSDNSIKLVAGTPFDESVTGSAQIAQYIPDIPRSVGVPLAAVRLVTGTTSIGWDAVYDMRDFYTVPFVPTGTIASVDTIGFAGLDEGVPLGTGTMLNVTGDLSLTRSGTMFNLNYVATAPAGGGGGQGMMIWDEGIPVATGTVLNFVGNGITATVSGTVAKVEHLDIGVRSRLSASFAASGSNASIAIPFDIDDWDTDNIHSITGSNLVKSKFSPNTTGRYLLMGNIDFAASATSTRGAGILLNGATTIALEFNDAASAGGTRMGISTTYPLVPGDFVQFVALQNSGGNLNLLSGSLTWFSMQLLA